MDEQKTTTNLDEGFENIPDEVETPFEQTAQETAAPAAETPTAETPAEEAPVAEAPAEEKEEVVRGTVKAVERDDNHSKIEVVDSMNRNWIIEASKGDNVATFTYGMSVGQFDADNKVLGVDTGVLDEFTGEVSYTRVADLNKGAGEIFHKEVLPVVRKAERDGEIKLPSFTAVKVSTAFIDENHRTNEKTKQEYTFVKLPTNDGKGWYSWIANPKHFMEAPHGEKTSAKTWVLVGKDKDIKLQRSKTELDENGKTRYLKEKEETTMSPKDLGKAYSTAAFTYKSRAENKSKGEKGKEFSVLENKAKDEKAKAVDAEL